MDILKLILAVIIPPLSVYLKVGLCGTFWLNILLTILGYVPGVLHALYVVLKIKRP